MVAIFSCQHDDETLLNENDQLNMAQGGLSLTYTFGSIYNKIVNPRFGNGGSGGEDIKSRQMFYYHRNQTQTPAHFRTYV
jgi:hypothetical protein